MKYALTITIVVFVSEIAKRSDKLGGLVAALPLVTLRRLSGSISNSCLNKKCQPCVVHILACFADAPYAPGPPALLSRIGLTGLVNMRFAHRTLLWRVRTFNASVRHRAALKCEDGGSHCKETVILWLHHIQ